MKKIFVLFIIIFNLNGCDTDKPAAEIDKLPAATQTGKNTIGCLVNGKALIPYGYLQTKQVCQYDGDNFSLGVGEKRNNEIHSVHVISYSDKLTEGQVYQLKAYGADSKFGEYTIRTEFGDHIYQTTYKGNGEFKITHLDSIHGVVSGTFWFDAIDENGEKAEIREGRFDMRAQ